VISKEDQKKDKKKRKQKHPKQSSSSQPPPPAESEETKAVNSTMSGGSGSVISTAFTHMRTVSAFSMHHKVLQHYTQITRRVAQVRVQRSITGAIGFGISNSMQYLVYALLFWYGSQLIQHEGLTFENMMISIMTLMMGVTGLGSALRDLGDQEEAAEIAEQVFQTIEESHSSPIDGISIQGIIPAERAIGRIELKNVSFRYPTRPDAEVCKSYNLVIEAGETVALVGPSGSGKVSNTIIFIFMLLTHIMIDMLLCCYLVYNH